MSLNELEVLGSEKPIGLSKLDQDLANSSVGGGFEDGNKDDDKVKNVTVEIPAKDLKPAQTGIKARDVIGIALDMLLSGEIGGDLGAIASSDSYIMDGHHRWAATYIIDPNAKLRVTLMDMPGEQLVTALNVITKGKLGIDVGNKEEGDIRSLNSHTLEPIIDSCIENGKPGNWPLTPEQVKQALSQVPGAGNYIQGKDVLLKNANLLPKDIMPNAPRRVDMPVIDQDKVDTAKTYLAKGSVDLKQPYSDKVATNISENIDDILTEWSYRIPKGYPTIVDGQFVDRDEVIILNQLLEERGLAVIELPEAAAMREPSIKNKTNLKEVMVCLFYDACKNTTLDKQIDNLQKTALQSTKKNPTISSSKQINEVIAQLQTIFKQNKKRYGSKNAAADSDEKGGSMPPDDLVDWIKWAYVSGDVDAAKSINNSLSSARAIRKQVGDAFIIRNELFDAIRSQAVKLAAEIGIPKLKPDNWCPGDVYIVRSLAVAESAANDTVSLNARIAGIPPLNSYFTKDLSGQTIVACSLKEEKAQAGKATEFLPKVFSAVYDSKIDRSKVKTDISAKEVGKIASAVKRYKEYSPSYPDVKATKRAKSYYNAIIKDDKIESSINTILKAVNKKPLKTSNIHPSKNAFEKNNKTIINQIEGAIKQVQVLISPDAVVDNLKAGFLKSRRGFIKYLNSLDVKVTAKNSEQLFQQISTTKDPVNIITKKTQAYDLASAIMNQWIKRDIGNKAYAKILKLTNPFAALTAFAVAETGINPGFWKFIGSEKGVEGYGHWFDPMAKVDIVVKDNMPIILNDSIDYAGFELDYNTKIGKDVYKTKLSFRFSDSQIRIEVSKLVKD